MDSLCVIMALAAPLKVNLTLMMLLDVADNARWKTDPFKRSPLNQNRSNYLMRGNLELDSVSFIMFFREIMCCVQNLLLSRATLSYQEPISS